ncbi:MAG: hypothetical protein HOV96_04630 [Nonomuraea sp.]|nr:hypothetical protein [Nonomuraea sp.]NUP61861.1 hypothetical protein [Nonomuraea sp.]NUP76823.1 hypothetical protein [Nonomuraea sp.]NUS06095.1 hypothetical protein [Nonomuraea sp.]
MNTFSNRVLTGAALLAALAGLAAARYRYDFRSPEVVIWSEPRNGATPAGTGSPGDGFDSDRSEEHETFRCDDLFDSSLWHHGTDATTGTVGWVPACYLDDPD